MSVSFTREDVSFSSDGETCAAWLYRPTGQGARPCIVLAHGFGGTREMGLDAFAERFARAGYVALAFDYRHFGGSSGEPRQLLDIKKQHDDLRRAIAFARGVAGVDPDRIVLWGTSFGGGHAIVIAAEDPRIAAVIAQVPHTNGPSAALGIGLATTLRLARVAVVDAIAAALGRPPRYVDVVGAPGALATITAPGALAGYHALLPPSASPRIDVAARVLLEVPQYSPGRRASRVRCPLLVLVAEKDRVTASGPAARAARAAPRGELIRYPIDHFDIYVGEPFERAIADQLAFLRRHVPSSARS